MQVHVNDTEPTVEKGWVVVWGDARTEQKERTGTNRITDPNTKYLPLELELEFEVLVVVWLGSSRLPGVSTYLSLMLASNGTDVLMS